MPELALTTLKFVFLALLYLFIARALRVIWTDLAGPRAGKPRRAAAAAGSARAPAPGRRPARAAPRSLVVVEDGQAPKTYALRGEVTIGRADECTIKLHDTYVSQLHTKVFSKDGAWHVADLGSTNGTYLNRVKISDPMPVSAGDEVRLGKTVVEVRAR